MHRSNQTVLTAYQAWLNDDEGDFSVLCGWRCFCFLGVAIAQNRPQMSLSMNAQLKAEQSFGWQVKLEVLVVYPRFRPNCLPIKLGICFDGLQNV